MLAERRGHRARRGLKLLAAIAFVLAACHRSGAWSDDPKNFERAWSQPAPMDLRIAHSWYWRSAHFTREEAYYFQFARHVQFMRSFIAENALQPVADASSVAISDYSCFSRPTWFAPKPMTTYNAWVMPPNAGRGLMLEDRVTGDFFISACEL